MKIDKPNYNAFCRQNIENLTNVSEPSDEKKGIGWLAEKMDSEEYNWLVGLQGYWLDFLGSRLNTARVSTVGNNADYATLHEALQNLPTGASTPTPGNPYIIRLKQGGHLNAIGNYDTIPSGVAVVGDSQTMSVFKGGLVLEPGSRISNFKIHNAISTDDGRYFVAKTSGLVGDSISIEKIILRAEIACDVDYAALLLDSPVETSIKSCLIDLVPNSGLGTYFALKSNPTHSDTHLITDTAIISRSGALGNPALNSVGIGVGYVDNSASGYPASILKCSKTSCDYTRGGYSGFTFTRLSENLGVRVFGLFMSYEDGGKITPDAQDFVINKYFDSKYNADKSIKIFKNLNLLENDGLKFGQSWQMTSAPGAGFLEFVGGCLLGNGMVFMAPYYYAGLTLLFDPISTEWVNSVNASPGGGAGDFSGAITMPNGDAFCVPFGYTGSNFLFSATDRGFYAAIDTPPSGGFETGGGCVLPDGNLMLIPADITANAVTYLYNPLIRVFGNGATMPGVTGSPFRGPIVLPSGKVFCPAHTYLGTSYIYDPVLDAWEAGNNAPPAIASGGSGLFNGACLLPNGKIFCAPRYYAGTRYLWDIATASYVDASESVPYAVGEDPGAVEFAASCKLLPGGFVMISPAGTASTKLVYDSENDTWLDYTTPEPGVGAVCFQQVMIQDGRLFWPCLFGEPRTIYPPRAYVSSDLYRAKNVG